jgi:hypothetical protein
LEISRQFNARYTANWVPNTALILRFTLYELCSRTYTMHFQLHIFRLQYSIEHICAAIRDNRLRCPLYCKFGANYSAHHPVYSMWTVVPDIYNVITAPPIQCFNIQLNVSALQLQISRQFNACYTTNLVPNTAHILQFSLCEQ